MSSHRYSEGERFSSFLKANKKGAAYVYFYCPKCTKPNGGYHTDLNALVDYAFKDWGEDPEGKKMKVRWEPNGKGCCFPG